MGYDEATMNSLGEEPNTVEIPDLQELSDLFDQACQARHEMGRQKYGEGTWLEANTIAMMQDEIVDMSNYARFSWIRLEIMRRIMDGVDGARRANPLPGKEMLGKEAFLPAGSTQ